MNKVLPLIPEKIYHIYNRGNNGDNIFLEDKNYSYFLGLCEKYLLPVIDIFAFCLLRNHFHLLVRVKTEYETIAISDLQGFKNLEGLDPTNQFSKFFNAYAKAINKQYSRTGSLFEKRFRRKIVSSAKYFCSIVHYIHFNPQKHGFVKDYREYHYSSYSIVLSHKQTKLDRTAVLGYFGGKEAYLEYHNAIPDEKMIYDFIQEDIETPGKQ